MACLKIRSVSLFSIAVTLVLAASCGFFLVLGFQQFENLQKVNDNHMAAEDAVYSVEEASNSLTNYARCLVYTGQMSYADQYFDELDSRKSREEGLAELETFFGQGGAYEALAQAISRSDELAETEMYAMRLALQAEGIPLQSLPDRLAAVQLSDEDAALSAAEMTERARDMLFDDDYRRAQAGIKASIEDCSANLLEITTNAQNHAYSMFRDFYIKLAIAVVAFALITMAVALAIRKLVVQPLQSYNESIRLGEIFPVVGAAELRHLAETYNRVYHENEERQMLIRHQAEHDSLTDLLNRGSFDKMLKLYEESGDNFALILVDVDTFKQVNDTYGHPMGDKILKHVANLLKITFRNIDHVCRIGGDEMAVIMVEMTSDLSYTITDKVAAINEQLSEPQDELPVVSISVGAAFTDRAHASDDLYKDADAALYYTKQHGRCGCTIYGQPPHMS